MVTILERTGAYRQSLRRQEYGDERDPEVRKVLEAISPANRAARIQSALLVAHGVNDPGVPVEEARRRRHGETPPAGPVPQGAPADDLAEAEGSGADPSVEGTF